MFWIEMPGSSKEVAGGLGRRGQLRPTVVAFADEAGVRGAFEALRSRRTAGKVVLDVSSSPSISSE